jgi:hypothetical protein
MPTRNSVPDKILGLFRSVRAMVARWARLVGALLREADVPQSDRKRLYLAVGIALGIHILGFLLIPGLQTIQPRPFETPLYVTFEPTPDDTVDLAEPELPPEPDPVPDDPAIEPPDAPPEPVGRIDPPTPPDSPTREEPDRTEPAELAGGDTAPDDAVASVPARPPEAAPTPAPARPDPDPSQPPSPEAAPAPVPEPSPAPAPAPPPADPEPVAPPPPPPIVQQEPEWTGEQAQRRFDPDALRAPSPTPGVDTAVLEEDLRVFYQWQENFEAELRAYEEEQDERFSGDELGTTRPDAAPGESELARQLSRMLAAIRDASNNVVTATEGEDGSDRPGASPSDDPTGPDGPEAGGDGSGVSVGSGTGTRYRVSGGSPDLRGLSLPAGFPAEYPVQVVFSVNSFGGVTQVRLSPPTPVSELNRRIREAVERWQFQTAPGSSSVNGSVTIIVETTTRR